jgi:hypothetical protein
MPLASSHSETASENMKLINIQQDCNPSAREVARSARSARSARRRQYGLKKLYLLG